MELRTLVERAAAAKSGIANASTKQKNDVLLSLAALLRSEMQLVLAANARDIEAGQSAGLSSAMIERLTLTPARLEAIAASLEGLALLADPVGEVVGGSVRPNGLSITQRRVPIGLIAMIYESRPNVTVDAAALCIKSGNASVLRGGKEAFLSNRVLADLIQQALAQNGFAKETVSLVEDLSRDSVTALLNMTGLIDLLIPRGGSGLIKHVVENARVPVIETGAGNCHVYVDECADLMMALDIAENAKMSRPSVCNSAETLLVHKAVAAEFLPMLQQRLSGRCELRGDDRARAIVPMGEASEQDWFEEYNDYILAVAVVDDVCAAADHINRYGTKHSECIVTNSVENSDYFLQNVDAAAVFRNASTRFTDGAEFGLSAEIGISTDKLHVRGPMGLEALTTTKYTVLGNGQIR